MPLRDLTNPTVWDSVSTAVDAKGRQLAPWLEDREDGGMGTNETGDGLTELCGILRVLADENRLRILMVLTQQETCVCDIMARLELPQPLASHHLGVLKRAGLVRDRQDAQWVYYSLDPERLAALNAQFRAFLGPTNLPPEAAYGAGRHVC